MELPVRKAGAWTLVEVLAVIVVLAVLLWMATPSITCGPDRSRMTETLAQAKSLQTAILQLTLDAPKRRDDGIEWTSVLSDEEETPVPIARLFHEIVNSGYMTQPELRKVLTVPGKGPGNASPTAENIAFKIFWVAGASPSDQPLITTANVQPGVGMERGAKPYGDDGFVVFTKGGSGGIYKRQTDARSTSIFPVANSSGGTPYRYTVLE